MKQSVRLKAIVYGSDFRKNDAHLFAEFQKSRNFPGPLAANEVYLFVSGRENQLIWFLQSIATETARGLPMSFIDSRRWRFTRGTRWNPGLLTKYADACGLQLIGLKSFKEAFADNLQLRLAHEREVRAKYKAKKKTRSHTRGN